MLLSPWLLTLIEYLLLSILGHRTDPAPMETEWTDELSEANPTFVDSRNRRHRRDLREPSMKLSSVQDLSRVSDELFPMIVCYLGGAGLRTA
mmetsp:Transcript_21042/g.29127  ORF Transcript_21042/g.29127 Transcript_21042/m.29127 type:complete len:92 (+) Transcript_21042:959-1234(+)